MFEALLKRFGLAGREKLKQRIADTEHAPNYKPRTQFFDELLVADLPLFTLRTAMLMMSDPIVQIANQMRDAALMPGEINVECGHAQAKAFIESQWRKIWTLHAPKIIMSRLFGFGGFEPRYKINPRTRQLEFSDLRSFAPNDTRALRDTQTGFVAGFNLRRSGGFGNEQILRPKALWTTFGARWGASYGTSILKRAYSPWYEKWMRHGAKKVQQLRLIKDSYVGDQLYYPYERNVQLPDGTVMPWRDVMREVGENRLAGGVITLPIMFDKDGNKMVEYVPPTDTGNPEGIFRWCEGLDDDICKALGVPPEVIQAAETGSGFSGRSIPMAAFLNGCMVEFGDYVQAVSHFVLLPLVWLNYGESLECTITPKPLIETFTADIGGSDVGGGAMGGGQGNPAVPQQQPLRISTGANGNGQSKQFDENDPHFNGAPRFSAAQFTEQLRSPKGRGVTIDGVFYPPGEWIPEDVAGKLSGEQWAKISDKPMPEKVETISELAALAVKQGVSSKEERIEFARQHGIEADNQEFIDAFYAAWDEHDKARKPKTRKTKASESSDDEYPDQETMERNGRVAKKLKDELRSRGWKVFKAYTAKRGSSYLQFERPDGDTLSGKVRITDHPQRSSSHSAAEIEILVRDDDEENAIDWESVAKAIIDGEQGQFSETQSQQFADDPAGLETDPIAAIWTKGASKASARVREAAARIRETVKKK